MQKIAFCIFVFLLSITGAQAQDISGQWQGTLHLPFRDLRLFLKITTADDGSRHATAYSPDQDPAPIPVDAVTLEGNKFKFVSGRISASYEGTLSADGNSISGQYTQTNGNKFPFVLQHATPDTAWAIDPSPHKVQFITVDSGITLEVLDWGGTGKPLVFLAGLGATGHIFDRFAPKFTSNHHVYAITRRGYGASSAPDPAHSDYSADRLGDDVVAVIDALKLDHPVLAGHSLAGEELSAVATRHPEKISGLIYLDAGYAYAYYAPGGLEPFGANIVMDLRELHEDSAMFLPDASTPSRTDIETFRAHLTEFEKDIAATRSLLGGMETSPDPKKPETSQAKITNAIGDQMEKYTAIHVPVLALYATDFKVPDTATAERRAENKAQNARRAHQVDLFEQGVPSSRVVRIAGAIHEIWVSNEADVMREMNAFLATLH